MPVTRTYPWKGPTEQPDLQVDPDQSTVEPRTLNRILLQFSTRLRELAAFVNGRLSLGTWTDGENAGALDAQVRRQVYFKTADTDVIVHHGLGRVPVQVFPGLPDKACSFYASNRELWTADYLYLRCSVSDVTVDLLVF